jgi:hypothetical protein
VAVGKTLFRSSGDALGFEGVVILPFSSASLLLAKCGFNGRATTGHHAGHGDRAAMCSRGVLVHCPSRLGAAAAVLAAKLQCSDGVFTKWALKGDKAVHHFDGVMSHSFNCSRLSRYDSEPKLHLATPSRVKWGFFANILRA